jgi:hypothetical protein
MFNGKPKNAQLDSNQESMVVKTKLLAIKFAYKVNK